MVNLILYASLFLIILSAFFFIIRLILGTTLADRILSLDGVALCLLLGLAISSILWKTNVYIDVILMITLIAFIGTVAFSYYILRGEIFNNANRS